MAGGVHEALGELLGVDTVERLMADGRYRRDVY
jgi:sulfite reductase (NADPH) flavoprotein alpha-component